MFVLAKAQGCLGQDTSVPWPRHKCVFAKAKTPLCLCQDRILSWPRQNCVVATTQLYCGHDTYTEIGILDTKNLIFLFVCGIEKLNVRNCLKRVLAKFRAKQSDRLWVNGRSKFANKLQDIYFFGVEK